MRIESVTNWNLHGYCFVFIDITWQFLHVYIFYRLIPTSPYLILYFRNSRFTIIIRNEIWIGHHFNRAMSSGFHYIYKSNFESYRPPMHLWKGRFSMLLNRLNSRDFLGEISTNLVNIEMCVCHRRGMSVYFTVLLW